MLNHLNNLRISKIEFIKVALLIFLCLFNASLLVELVFHPLQRQVLFLVLNLHRWLEEILKQLLGPFEVLLLLQELLRAFVVYHVLSVV